MIKGVHATCRLWAQSIYADGFISSNHGRVGPGCYFWRYHSDSVFAEFLGFSWWKAEHKRGTYNAVSGVSQSDLESAKKCSLLVCDIAAEGDSEVLDLSSGELKENLRELLRFKLKQLRDAGELREHVRDKAISELIDVFIRGMEDANDTGYKAIIADVAVPKGAGGQIGAYMGASAEAVIARDAGCITVREIKEFDAYDYV